MTTRNPLIGTKSVTEKMEKIKQEELTSTEVAAPQDERVLFPIEKTHLEKQQAMKKFGLVNPKKGSRVDIDQDLHNRFKIAAIKMNKTQKEWLEEIIEEAVLKAEKKYEKTI